MFKLVIYQSYGSLVEICQWSIGRSESITAMRMTEIRNRGKLALLPFSESRSCLRLHRQFIVTKGDNNEVDDVPMYPIGRAFVTRDEIVGMVVGYVPYLGWVSIALQKVISTWYILILIVAAVSLIV
jgi:hypothetical protein